jgi:hypothetical protein
MCRRRGISQTNFKDYKMPKYYLFAKVSGWVRSCVEATDEREAKDLFNNGDWEAEVYETAYELESVELVEPPEPELFDLTHGDNAEWAPEGDDMVQIGD